MKYQVLFSLKKKNEKVFMHVVCCSRDGGFKGQIVLLECHTKCLDCMTGCNLFPDEKPHNQCKQ